MVLFEKMSFYQLCVESSINSDKINSFDKPCEKYFFKKTKHFNNY